MCLTRRESNSQRVNTIVYYLLSKFHDKSYGTFKSSICRHKFSKKDVVGVNINQKLHYGSSIMRGKYINIKKSKSI